MRWNTVLFDLDGTLTESGPGIMKAAQYALRAYGIEKPWQSLSFFVGPPLNETFASFVPAEDIPAIVEKFREYYRTDGWLDNAPYPGVPEMLQGLRDAGCKLYVATSKPEAMAVRVLEHFGLSGYFEAVCGAPEGDPEAGKKVNAVKAALRSARCTEPGRTVMVGDRRHDVQGAGLAGLETVGVLYGYGSREELETAGAAAIAATPEEVKKLILSSI